MDKKNLLVKDTTESLEVVDFELVEFDDVEQMEDVVICFFGGEPLIYPENLLELAYTILKEYENRGLEQPVFSINTNGTIMPDRIIEFLKQYQVLTTISIDGLKSYHDKHRIMKDGTGSYDLILDNLRKLEERKFKLTAEVTVNKSLIEDYKPGISKRIVDNIMDLIFYAILLSYRQIKKVRGLLL